MLDVELRLPPELIATAKPEGTWVLELPGSRRSAKMVDSDTMGLLEQFRQPSSLVAAVLRHAAATGDDAEKLLDLCWPALVNLFNSGYIRRLDDERRLVQPHYAHDAVVVGRYRVHRCIRCMEDAQVYIASRVSDGRRVALKVAGTHSEAHERAIRWEAQVYDLGRGSNVVPEVVEVFPDDDGLASFATAWFEGTPLASLLGKMTRTEALPIAHRITDAYGALHSVGILHGDVNPSNVLIGPDAVRLVDFAAGRVLGRMRQAPIMGVLDYQAPELCGRRKVPDSLPSSTSEQYSVAALAFHVVTGTPPIAPSEVREVAVARIERNEIRTFRELGVMGVGGVETVLRRALAQEPKSRFRGVAAFANALNDARPKSGAVAVRDDFLGRVLPGGAWHRDGLPVAPSASVALGAGGVALALLELAIDTDSPAMLDVSRHWLERARAQAALPFAFQNEKGDLDEVVAEGVSIYHTPRGLHWVGALVYDSMCDMAARNRALRMFSRMVEGDPDDINPDLTLGRAGGLAAIAALYERTSWAPLLRSGDIVAERLWSWSARVGPMGSSADRLNLGMAHGWAGVLWAAARWSVVSGTPLPQAAMERAQELLHEGVAKGTGLAWPWHASGRRSERLVFAPGWCNGAVGFVLSFIELNRATNDSNWLSVAERAAYFIRGQHWHTGHFCCGGAAAVLALGRLAAATGDPVWAREAVRVRDEALLTAHDGHPAGLMRGDAGIALVDVGEDQIMSLRIPGLESP